MKLPMFILPREPERVDFLTGQREPLRPQTRRVTDPQRRADHKAVAEPPNQRARAEHLSSTGQNATKQQPAALGRRRLRKRETRRRRRGARWRDLLTKQERAEFDAAEPGYLEYKRLGLGSEQGRAKYAAEPDPSGERARHLQRMRLAFNTIQRLVSRARRRLGNRPMPSEPPPWFHHLNEQERAEYEAARPDALEFVRQHLELLRVRAEYEAVPDPTGERARNLQRMIQAHRVYQRLGNRGRRRIAADYGSVVTGGSSCAVL
jgi:hypothetical protein